MNLFRKNHFMIGFLAGLVFPFFGAVIFYLLFFSYMDPEYFVKHLAGTGKWVEVLSLGVILNLGAFFLFMRNNAERSSRGVLGATFIFAFMAVYYKAF